MKVLSRWGLAGLATAMLGSLATFASCSSSPSYGNNPFGSAGGLDATMGSDDSSPGNGNGNSDAGSGGGPTDAMMLVTYDGRPPNVDGGLLSCSTPSGLPIKFNPVYSGFDGVHNYQVPVFVEGVDPATVTWGSSDPTMVAFQPYVRGIMITTRKAGDVTIIARLTSGSKCGSAPLHISQYAPSDWDTGNMRYNNSNPLNFSADAAGITIPSGATLPDGGFDASAACTDPTLQNLMNPFESPPAACTNCHGMGSNGQLFGMTVFSDVEHTPEQTGGFSDNELTNVFVNATIPDGGYFNQQITPYCLWHKWHTWRDINTAAAQTGMMSYLRALTPQEQLGCFELFNAMMCADGG
jgi:hypothetical protein